MATDSYRAGPASAAPSVRPWRSGGGETEALELPVTPVLPSFSFSFSSCLPLMKSQGEEDVLHGIADGIESIRTRLVGLPVLLPRRHIFLINRELQRKNSVFETFFLSPSLGAGTGFLVLILATLHLLCPWQSGNSA